MSAFNLDLFDDAIVDGAPYREPNNNMPFKKRYLPRSEYIKQEPTKKRSFQKPTPIPDRPEGRLVDTYSELWKRECMAREIARMPQADQYDFFEKWLNKHGHLENIKLLGQVNAIYQKGFLEPEEL